MLEKCKVTTEDIGDYLIYLPGKDFSIGSKFLAERKFKDLRDLVDSCIKKYRISETFRQKYPDFDEDGMRILKEHVYEYSRFLDIEEDYEDNNNDLLDTLADTESYEEFCYFIMAGERRNL